MRVMHPMALALGITGTNSFLRRKPHVMPVVHPNPIDKRLWPAGSHALSWWLRLWEAGDVLRGNRYAHLRRASRFVHRRASKSEIYPLERSAATCCARQNRFSLDLVVQERYRNSGGQKMPQAMQAARIPNDAPRSLSDWTIDAAFELDEALNGRHCDAAVVEGFF
jgi:hypothetical protein